VLLSGACEAPDEVGGPKHGFACCCTGPGGPARGRRSAMGGGMAMGLRTLGLLMGEVKARTMIDRSWPPWERRRPRRLTL
jgi:hypothetical protein